MCFPEGTRRRGTGTGGMVVREVTVGGVSSTVREKGVMCMLAMCNVSTSTHHCGRLCSRGS